MTKIIITGELSEELTEIDETAIFDLLTSLGISEIQLETK